jgi:hypothetical protein
MAKCPFAQWMPLPWSAGPYVAGPFKIVHHTTEGSTAAGAFNTYRQRHDIPHFTVDDQAIYQHLDTDVAATALAHPAEPSKPTNIRRSSLSWWDSPENRKRMPA